MASDDRLRPFAAAAGVDFRLLRGLQSVQIGFRSAFGVGARRCDRCLRGPQIATVTADLAVRVGALENGRIVDDGLKGLKFGRKKPVVRIYRDLDRLDGLWLCLAAFPFAFPLPPALLLPLPFPPPFPPAFPSFLANAASCPSDARAGASGPSNSAAIMNAAAMVLAFDPDTWLTVYQLLVLADKAIQADRIVRNVADRRFARAKRRAERKIADTPLDIRAVECG